MEVPQNTKFSTSFLPKKPIVPSANIRRTSSSIFLLIAMMIFIATVVGSVGVFLYKESLKVSIKSQEENIRKYEGKFDDNFINVAKKLDDRINSIKMLIDRHQSPSAVFKLLEDKTLGTVQFGNFSYSSDSDGKIKITANGKGLSFKSIVLQSDEFGKTGVLQDVVFSSVEPTSDGLVNFSFSGGLDEQWVLYKKNLSRPGSTVENNTSTSTNTSATATSTDNKNRP